MAKGAERKLECYGFSKVNTQGQMQIPADARKALGLESGTRVMVFADRGARHLVVAIKPSDEELLELASEQVTEGQ